MVVATFAVDVYLSVLGIVLCLACVRMAMIFVYTTVLGERDPGPFFTMFLEPKSVAIFRPHSKWNRKQNISKKGSFSGRHFGDGNFSYF